MVNFEHALKSNEAYKAKCRKEQERWNKLAEIVKSHRFHLYHFGGCRQPNNPSYGGNIRGSKWIWSRDVGQVSVSEEKIGVIIWRTKDMDQLMPLLEDLEIKYNRPVTVTALGTLD